MKELGITKREEQKAKDFFNKAYSLCKWHISYPTHGWIAKLMVHFSREQNTELLQRYNEAIEAVNVVLNIKNPYSREKEYEQWAAAENVIDDIIRNKKFQQTISKSKK